MNFEWPHVSGAFLIFISPDTLSISETPAKKCNISQKVVRKSVKFHKKSCEKV